jgi:hypothetical protein
MRTRSDLQAPISSAENVENPLRTLNGLRTGFSTPYFFLILTTAIFKAAYQ